MKLRVDATPEELEEKAPDLVKAMIELLRPASPDMADVLEKAIPSKEQELKFPVLRALQKQTEVAYDKQMDKMMEDIGKVLDKSLKTSVFKKSEDAVSKEKSPDYTKQIVAKDEKSYEQIKAEFLNDGYSESDFEVGGTLFGYSTNQLIDMQREKNDGR